MYKFGHFIGFLNVFKCSDILEQPLETLLFSNLYGIVYGLATSAVSYLFPDYKPLIVIAQITMLLISYAKGTYKNIRKIR